MGKKVVNFTRDERGFLKQAEIDEFEVPPKVESLADRVSKLSTDPERKKALSLLLSAKRQLTKQEEALVELRKQATNIFTMEKVAFEERQEGIERIAAKNQALMTQVDSSMQILAQTLAEQAIKKYGES